MQPAVARLGGGRVARLLVGDGFLEIGPAAFEPVPAPVDLLADALALGEVVGDRCESLDGGLRREQLGEEVRRQQAAFGGDRGEGGRGLHGFVPPLCF